MRLAESTDIDSLAAVYQEAVTYANRVGQIDWPNPIPESFVAELIASEDLYCFGEKSVIAAARISSKGDKRIWADDASPAIYLAKLATGDQVRGQDYFRNTMLPVIIDLVDSDMSLRLDCLADNVDLHEYYCKLGFIGLGDVSFHSEKKQRVIKVRRFEMLV